MKTLTLCIKGKNQIDLATMKGIRKILTDRYKYKHFEKFNLCFDEKKTSSINKDFDLIIVNECDKDEVFVRFEHQELCWEMKMEMLDTIITMMETLRDIRNSRFEHELNKFVLFDEFTFEINENCIKVIDRFDTYEDELDELEDKDYEPKD